MKKNLLQAECGTNAVQVGHGVGLPRCLVQLSSSAPPGRSVHRPRCFGADWRQPPLWNWRTLGFLWDTQVPFGMIWHVPCLPHVFFGNKGGAASDHSVHWGPFASSFPLWRHPNSLHLLPVCSQIWSRRFWTHSFLVSFDTLKRLDRLYQIGRLFHDDMIRYYLDIRIRPRNEAQNYTELRTNWRVKLVHKTVPKLKNSTHHTERQSEQLQYWECDACRRA